MTGESAAGRRDSRFCGARKRQGEGDCARPAGWGTSHPGWGSCKLHGGSTQSGITAAERERAEAALAEATRTYGLPLDVEPGEALLGLVRTGAGVCAWLGTQVAAIPPDKATTAGGKPHPLIALYLEERKHLAQVAKACHDAGLAERQVRLQEEQGRLIGQIFERLLTGLDELTAVESGARVVDQNGRAVLDPMNPRVRELVRRELAAIGEAA